MRAEKALPLAPVFDVGAKVPAKMVEPEEITVTREECERVWSSLAAYMRRFVLRLLISSAASRSLSQCRCLC